MKKVTTSDEREKTFYSKGDECVITSEPYTLYGGEFVDAFILETGKKITVATKIPLRQGVKLKQPKT